MPKKSAINREDSQTIALKALTFLLSDPDRTKRFMGITGTSPETIRGSASQPAFLSGVLEYLSGDEPLLLLFAESEGLDPEHICAASRRLEN